MFDPPIPVRAVYPYLRLLTLKGNLPVPAHANAVYLKVSIANTVLSAGG